MPDVLKANYAGPATMFRGKRIPAYDSSSCVSYARGISFGGIEVTSTDSGTAPMRNYLCGVAGKNTTEGSPSQPSLELTAPESFRFRWVVSSGNRTISINAKQKTFGTPTDQRPSLVVRANRTVGLDFDLSASAANGDNWTTIGPLSFTATSTGVLWVEMRNNLHLSYPSSSVYFDHIVAT